MREAGSADGPVAVFSFVGAVLPFTSCLVTLLASGRPPVLLYDDIRPERHEAVVDAYLRGAYLLDPFYNFLGGGLDRRVVKLQEIQPDHFRKSEYFSTYYTDTRLVDEVGIFVPRREGSHIFVSLGRAAGTATFSARSFQRLQSLMPVIEALLVRQWDAERLADTAAGPVTLDGTLQQSGFSSLSAREREIVALILKGHSSKSIAWQLAIAVGTVKNHRKNIYRKLNITSQSALFALFLDSIGDRASATPPESAPDRVTK
jgi:DNA-binding CsgD family transcriptional regulator